MSHLTEILTGSEAQQIDETVAEKLDRNLARKEIEKSELQAENSRLSQEVEDLKNEKEIERFPNTSSFPNTAAAMGTMGAQPNVEIKSELGSMSQNLSASSSMAGISSIIKNPHLQEIQEMDDGEGEASIVSENLNISNPFALKGSGAPDNTNHDTHTIKTAVSGVSSITPNINELPFSPLNHEAVSTKLKLQEAYNELDSLKMELTQEKVNSNNKDLEFKCQTMSLNQREKEVETLTLEYNKLKLQLDESNNQCHKYVEEIGRLQSNDINKDYELKKSDRKLTDLTSKVAQMNVNFENLNKAKIEDRQSIFKEREDFNEKIEALNKLLLQKDDNISNLKVDMDKMTEELKGAIELREKKEDEFCCMKLAKEKEILAFKDVVQAYSFG